MTHRDSNSSCDLNNIQLKILQPRSECGSRLLTTSPSNSCSQKCDDGDELSTLISKLEKLLDNPTSNTKNQNTSNKGKCDDTYKLSNLMTTVDTTNSNPSASNLDNERENLSTSVSAAKLAIDKALESVKNLESNRKVFIDTARMRIEETYKTATDFINLLEKQGDSNKDIRDIINKLKWDPIVKLLGLDKLVDDLDNGLNKSHENVINFLSIINSRKN